MVTAIAGPELEELCLELGLEETIVPARTCARFLEDIVAGLRNVELPSVLEHGARLFTFTAEDADGGSIEDLDLPDASRAICVYRDERMIVADPETRLSAGDEIVVLAHQDDVPRLEERWRPRTEADRSDR